MDKQQKAHDLWLALLETLHSNERDGPYEIHQSHHYCFFCEREVEMGQSHKKDCIYVAACMLLGEGVR